MKSERLALALGAGIALQLGLSALYEALGVGHDPSVYERLAADPAKELFVGVVAAPVIEEVLFRGMPLRFFPGADALSSIGLTSTALFTASHGSLSPDIFAKGIFYWHIAQKYGLRSAVAAHGATNLTYYGVVAALYA